MHEKALTKNTKSVLDALNTAGIVKDFYLVGGTALALYFGHRFSVDLDWFAEKLDYTPIFRRQLEKLGKLGVDSESENTFNGALNGVKISFFKYPYPLISSKSRYKKNIFLAGIPDIAAMKLEAIGSRGSYKDFIDIYFLLQKYFLEELLGFVRKKFDNDLYFGIRDSAEVSCLQGFLRNQGADIYPEGLVTGNFLSLTQVAVTRFQEKYAQEILHPLGLQSGTGYVGEMTRAKINQLINF